MSRLLNFTHVIMNPGGSKKSDRHHQQQHQQQQHQHQHQHHHQHQHQHQQYASQVVRLTFISQGGFVYYWDTKDQHLRNCIFTGATSKMIYPRLACAFGDDGLFLIMDDGKMFRGRIKEYLKSSVTGEIESEKGGGAVKLITSASREEKFPQRKSSSAATAKSPIGAEKKTFADGKSSASKKAAETDFKWTSNRALATKAAAGYYSGRENFDSVDSQSIILSAPIFAAHRAITASTTSDGRNFCIIQQSPKSELTELPTKSASMMSADYSMLLSEADVSDCLHDLQIRTAENGAQYRAVHKFILCSRCPYFAKRIQPSTTHLQIEEPPHVVTEFALDRILDYLYTDDCDLFHEGSITTTDNRRGCLHDIGNGETTEKGRDPLREVLEAAKRLGVKAFIKRLESMRWDNATKTVMQASRNHQGPLRLRFEPNAFPELCDVRLKCKNNVHLPAHRCVLSSRSEYFRCMFASGWWSETGRNQTLNVDIESDVLTPVLHYLYTDELPPYSMVKSDEATAVGREDLYATADKDMLEHYGKILVCADQWLLDRLRQLCEIELAARITLRNAADMLEFARAVNADQLFASCAQFISLNLCALLEANALRSLSSDCLRRVGSYYRDFYPHVGHRAVAPFESPSVSEIEAVWNEVTNSGVSSDEILQEYLSSWTQIQAGDSPTSKKKRTGPATTPRARRTSASAATIVDSPTENDIAAAASAKPSNLESIAPTPLKTSNAANIIPAQERKPAWGQADKETTVDKAIRKSVSTPSQPIAVPMVQTSMRSKNKPWNVALSPMESFPEVSLRDLMQAEEKKEASIVTERRKSSGVAAMRQVSSPTDHKSAMPAWTSTSPPSFMVSTRPIASSPPDQSDYPTPATAPKKPSQKSGANRTFSDIVMEERSKEAARARILNKPLKIIQDEELAIQELVLIYQIDDNWDEFITVERAVADVSEPTWQAHIGSPPRF